MQPPPGGNTGVIYSKLHHYTFTCPKILKKTRGSPCAVFVLHSMTCVTDVQRIASQTEKQHITIFAAKLLRLHIRFHESVSSLMGAILPIPGDIT